MSSKKPIRVEVRAKYPDEPIERMIKRFNKKVIVDRLYGISFVCLLINDRLKGVFLCLLC